MKSWFYIIGTIVTMIAGAVFGLYVGLWLMFIGGIVQIVESVKETPVDAMGIALGIARFVLSKVSGWITFSVFGAIANALIKRA